jgi:LPS sulfotransferase NodH
VPPVPVILSAPRSGSTLLRLMLDAHSQLAMMGENMFPLAAAAATTRANFVTRCQADEGWSAKLNATTLSQRLAALPSFNRRACLDELMRLYAEAYGKTRWGIKSPGYALCMDEVAQIRDIHAIVLIRDGRDVAVSMEEAPLLACGDIRAAATSWRWFNHFIKRGIAQNSIPFTRINYERLVQEPQVVLAELCTVLELPYESRMLEYWQFARDRLYDDPAAKLPDGSDMPAEQKLYMQRLLNDPPTASRVGRWRDALNDTQKAAVQAEIDDVLTVEGY